MQYAIRVLVNIDISILFNMQTASERACSTNRNDSRPFRSHVIREYNSSLADDHYQGTRRKLCWGVTGKDSSYTQTKKKAEVYILQSFTHAYRQTRCHLVSVGEFHRNNQWRRGKVTAYLCSWPTFCL